MCEKEKENPWKRIGYCGTTIEIDGKKGQYGVDEWKLKLKKDGQEILADFGASISMSELSGRIRGIEDFCSLEHAKDNNFDFAGSKEELIKMWLGIGRIGREIRLNCSSDVAYIQPLAICVKGMKVIPKPKDDPKQDGTVAKFCNFWIANYGNGIVFRLSSHDVNKYTKVNARASTKYVDLDPINDRDIIQKILTKSVAIYMPDMSADLNMRSFVF